MSKIIFVNRYYHPDLSATSQMLSDLTVSLATGGRKICVVTSRQLYDDPDQRLVARDSHNGVEIFRVWTTRFGRMNLAGRALDYLSFYFSAFFALLRITSAGDVIVAKTDPPLISVVAWVVVKVRRARLINWLQDVFPEVAAALGVLHARLVIAFARWLRNVSIRGAVANVVLGERMRLHIREQGVASERIAVIPNWADGELIRPVSRDANPLRNSWGLQNKFVVGYSGNMGRAHEVDTIVSAMTYLQDDPDILFLFTGGGAGKKQLESEIRSRGIKNYQFRPYQPRDHMSESLSVADVHLVSLLPSLEGFIVPSKVYGIAAAGRPMVFIGDPEGEVPRMVNSCHMGFVVKVGDDAELSRRLTELKERSASTQRMGENGRRCFDADFNMARAVRQWEDLLG